MWCRPVLLVPVILAALVVFFPWTTALAVAAPLGVAAALIAYAGWRALWQPVMTGAEGLRGGRGEAVSDLTPAGLVRLRDALWLAEAWQPVGKGQPVEGLEVVGATVRVRPWS